VCACAHIHNFARVAFTHALILLNAPVHAFTCVFLCLFNHATICTDTSLQDTWLQPGSVFLCLIVLLQGNTSVNNINTISHVFIACNSNGNANYITLTLKVYSVEKIGTE